MSHNYNYPFKIKISNSKNEFIEIDASGYLSDLAHTAKNAFAKRSRYEVDDLIYMWTNSKSGKAYNSLSNALEHGEVYIEITNGGKTMTINRDFWFDINKIPRDPEADEWVKTYSDTYKGTKGSHGKMWEELPSNEYRANLMFDEGFTGLPEESHFRRTKDDKPIWTNPEVNHFRRIPFQKLLDREIHSKNGVVSRIGNYVMQELASKGY